MNNMYKNIKCFLRDKLELSHGKNSSNYPMEGIRGVAVLLVFFVHYSSLSQSLLAENSVTLKINTFIHTLGNTGVDLFFVLSGFLIYGSIISKVSFEFFVYIKRRIMRIYPPFLTIFLIYIVLSFLFPSESKLPGGLYEIILYLIQNLLFIQGFFDVDPMITVAWTLSYEFFYYLIIPVIIFTLKLSRWSCDQRIIFWCLLSSFLFLYFFLFEGPVRMLMFVSGILLYEAVKVKKLSYSHGGTTILIISLFFYGCKSFIDIDYVFSIFIQFLSFFAFSLVAFSKHSKCATWLSFLGLRWLGNMSYSYYLMHGLILKICFGVFFKLNFHNLINESVYYWLWLPFFILTVFGSLALYLVVENPFSLAKKIKADIVIFLPQK